MLRRVKSFKFRAGLQLINKSPYWLQNPCQHKRNPIQKAAGYQVGSTDCCLLSLSISVINLNLCFSFSSVSIYFMFYTVCPSSSACSPQTLTLIKIICFQKGFRFRLLLIWTAEQSWLAYFVSFKEINGTQISNPSSAALSSHLRGQISLRRLVPHDQKTTGTTLQHSICVSEFGWKLCCCILYEPKDVRGSLVRQAAAITRKRRYKNI